MRTLIHTGRYSHTVCGVSLFDIGAIPGFRRLVEEIEAALGEERADYRRP
jgi:hypothetical protein